MLRRVPDDSAVAIRQMLPWYKVVAAWRTGKGDLGPPGRGIGANPELVRPIDRPTPSLAAPPTRSIEPKGTHLSGGGVGVGRGGFD
jgi:hypothetical protein